MLYKDALLKTFNDSYADLLTKQEQLRKDIATMIYCFITNNKSSINYYLGKYMSDSAYFDTVVWNPATAQLEKIASSNKLGLFSASTIKIMPKIHLPIVNKVVTLVCTIYNAGADRYMANKETGVMDEDATQDLNELYSGMNYAQRITDIYQMGWLFNTILVEPVVIDDKMTLDIITPNFCSVTTHDNDYTKLKEVMISKSVDGEDVIEYWSDTEHYYINSKGDELPVKKVDGKDNGKKNPYGQLPFAVLRFDNCSDFWGEPQQDLVENNIWYDIRESNMMFVEMFQGLGVGVGVNLGKSGSVAISPATIINVDKVQEGQVPPSLSFESTNAPLTELRESNDAFYKRIGNSKGLSSASLTNEVSDQSGISKAYDSLELQINKDSHKIIMKNFETKELFSKIRLVNNTYAKEN